MTFPCERRPMPCSASPVSTPTGASPPPTRQLERFVEQLAEAYERTCTDDWCWFEDELSYDNARLSQALLAGAYALDRPELAEVGLESLRWLGDECGLDKSTLRLTGSPRPAGVASPRLAPAMSSRSTPRRSSKRS